VHQLAVTPLRFTLELADRCAACWACSPSSTALHFTTFLWFDHFFDVQECGKMLKRPFITVGFIAFVLLIPLATSTNGMIKRLGGKRWQWLHRLIYVIAPLAILHFWWMKAGKHNFAQPILFGTIIALLLAIRVFRLEKTRAKRQGGRGSHPGAFCLGHGHDRWRRRHGGRFDGAFGRRASAAGGLGRYSVRPAAQPARTLETTMAMPI
jgi:hypothetical protein